MNVFGWGHAVDVRAHHACSGGLQLVEKLCWQQQRVTFCQYNSPVCVSPRRSHDLICIVMLPLCIQGLFFLSHLLSLTAWSESLSSSWFEIWQKNGFALFFFLPSLFTQNQPEWLRLQGLFDNWDIVFTCKQAKAGFSFPWINISIMVPWWVHLVCAAVCGGCFSQRKPPILKSEKMRQKAYCGLSAMKWMQNSFAKKQQPTLTLLPAHGLNYDTNKISCELPTAM